MTKSTDTPTVASVEGDLFGTLVGFHKKVMALVRQSSLNDEQMKVVGERINSLLDNVLAEMESPQQMNLTERLEAVYGEVKKLIEKLSGLSRAEQ